MLQSPAMIALMLCDFANSWGLYVLVTEGPIFFSEALCFDIKKVGFLSSLPYLGRFVGAQIFGLISSLIRRRNAMSALALQKLNAFISFVGPAAGRDDDDAEMSQLVVRDAVDVPRDLQSLLVHSNHVSCIRFQWSSLFWPLQYLPHNLTQ